MAGKRQLQKAQTRERIIAAAIKVYSEYGFSAPTTAISKEAQVSHGSIFVHFPTVESLLVCLLEIFSQDINAELHSLSESSNDIEKLLDMHISVLIKYEDFYKRLIKEAVYLPEEAKNTFIAIQSTVSIHFLQVLEPEISAGKIKEVPFHMLFNTWLGLVHYYLLNSDLFAPRDSVLKRYKNTLIECFIALIKQ
ncbi:MAG TPA: helix-turn-helix domain-containing protein [Desulfitobacteriaceae bacterium]|jgi:AcrR family transcriptional regulator|nr:helix-turn-helix domain-containing protein [Desulfitobacteriaceae bacterium]